MASVRQGNVTRVEAEKTLVRALGNSAADHISVASLRLENLRFTDWCFHSWDFNETKLVNCEFINCNFSNASMFGTVIIDSDLAGSQFGNASLMNALGVIQDGEIEALYDNNEIRLWLLSCGARVNSDDLRIVTEEVLPSNELLEHIMRRFFPRGSDAQQRQVLVTSLTKSLPPHRVAEVSDLNDWLGREQVMVPGPTFRQRRTVQISNEWRDDIAVWMREGRIRPRVEEMISRSLER